MTRMTGPDCAVMRNLINTHTHVTRTSLEIPEKARSVFDLDFELLTLTPPLKKWLGKNSTPYYFLKPNVLHTLSDL